MPTFQFTGPERAALVRDPVGILPPLAVAKGKPFPVEEPRLITLLRELPAFEEVKELKEEPKPSLKKADGKS